jgi:hypothetical protein
MEYGVYDTWDTNIHWYAWRGVEVGNGWGIYGVTAFMYQRPTIPTLTEWGMIIFGVVLLGFITWVFLRRRRPAVSYQ